MKKIVLILFSAVLITACKKNDDKPSHGAPVFEASIGNSEWDANFTDVYVTDSIVTAIGRSSDDRIISLHFRSAVLRDSVSVWAFYGDSAGNTRSFGGHGYIDFLDVNRRTVSGRFYLSQTYLGTETIIGAFSNLPYKTAFPAPIGPDKIILDKYPVAKLNPQNTSFSFEGENGPNDHVFGGCIIHGPVMHAGTYCGYGNGGCLGSVHGAVTFTKHDLLNRYIEGTISLARWHLNNDHCHSLDGSFAFTYY